jgi:hypothetical protein
MHGNEGCEGNLLDFRLGGTTIAWPVPGELLGGTSSAPVRLAKSVIVAA